ncbi:MAG: hypothetical protein K5931_11620 [Lachnospiraceae bacterium]|nr:hypothetical protein [Lachnospiraceae bacterium]
MNSRLKNALKLILIAVIFIGVYFFIDRLFLLKSKEGILQMHSLYKQDENTVDVLFVGSSHIFIHVNNGILWEEQGLSSYDLASAEQPFWISYYYIKEALKTQKPKLIVLDITTPGVRPVDFQPENWMATNNYGFKYNKNYYDALKSNTLEQSFRRLLIPLNSMHGRYNDLREEDFTDPDNSKVYKGFDSREGTTVFEEAPAVKGITGREPISEKEEKYLRILIEYLKEENIPLLLVSSPYVLDAKSQAKFNTIFDIADEYQVPYVDFNKLYDELKLDFTKDMQEDLHLNKMGNAKYSSYLGKYIKDNYDIEDHRADEKYASWDEFANFLRQDNARFYMSQISDINVYKDLFLDNYENVKMGNYKEFIKGDSEAIDTYIAQSSLTKYFYGDSNNYTVFVQIGPDVVNISDDLHSLLNTLGIPEESLRPLEAMVFKGGKCIYDTGDKAFRKSIDRSCGSLLFAREEDEYDEARYHTRLQILNEKHEFSESGISFLIYDESLKRVVDEFHIEDAGSEIQR